MVTRRLLASVGWWHALTGAGPARLLSLNALTDAAGTGLAAVCLPFLAVTVLGLSGSQAAILLSVAGVLELLAAVPNGALAARIGVRTFVCLGKVVQGVGYVVMALAQNYLTLLLLSVLIGAARAGANGLSQGLAVQALGEEQRSGVLGSIRALRNIGYLLAGGLSGLILAAGSGPALRAAILVNGLTFLVGAWWIRRLPTSDQVGSADRIDLSVLRDASYLGLILGASVFASSLAVLDIGLPLWVIRNPGVPRWTVGMVVVVNTLLVLLLQFRFAEKIGTIGAAVKALRWSSVAFLGGAVLLALSHRTSTWVSVAVLLATAVALTFGELTESPAWWTISYNCAPEALKNQYLATFDLCWAVVAIAGPPAMAGIVALGSTGWLIYGAVLVVAGQVGIVLTRRRPQPVAAAG